MYINKYKLAVGEPPEAGSRCSVVLGVSQLLERLREGRRLANAALSVKASGVILC